MRAFPTRRLRKAAKLAIAVPPILIGAALLLNQSLTLASADAVVDARIVTVRAPIEGVLDRSPLQIGDAVQRGERLGALHDSRSDEALLSELERQEAAAKLDLAEIKAKTAEIDGARTRLLAQSDAYQDARVQQTDGRIAEAAAGVRAAEAVAAESAASYARMKLLLTKGVEPAAAVEKALSVKERDAEAAAAAAQRLDTLKSELAAAKKGVFVVDTIDVDWSRQQDEELQLRRDELQADAEDRARRIADLDARIAAEQARVAERTDAALVAPAAGEVWRIAAGSGEYVNKGEDLLQIVDCASVLVVAGVDEKDFNRLRVGGAATFRALGADKVYDARIVRLAGSAGGSAELDMAVPATAEHARRYDVTLNVPGLATDSSLRCGVGRTGKVVFEKGLATPLAKAAPGTPTRLAANAGEGR